MSYPKQLLRLQPQRGVIYDTADQEVSEEFYTQARNVLFRDGFATRVRGRHIAYEAEIGIINPGVFFHGINTLLGNANWWLLFQKDGTAHAIQSGVVEQIDNLLLNPTDHPWQFSSSLINGIPVISNSLNEPVYWPGVGNLLPLPDWPVTESCKSISVLKFHIFACNISGPGGQFDNVVRWSSATEPGAVPQDWTPSANNDAGSVTLADSPGPILCAVPLGDALFIYKRTATYQARYVGGQNVFNFRKVESATGALTPRSVADIGGAHLIVTDGDIVLSDGTTRKSIGESRVKDYLFDQLDQENYLQLFCVYNPVRDEVVIGFPSTGSEYCNEALVYDISRDAFGVVEFDQVTQTPVGLVRDTVLADTWINRTEFWVLATAPWSTPLTSAAIDSLVILKPTEMVQTDTNVATALEAMVGRSGLTFGDPERVKFVKSIRIRTREKFTELFVKVGGQMTANGVTTWSDEVRMTAGDEIANLFAVGRYIAVEVRSSDENPWKLTGIDIEAEMRGYF